MQNIIVMLYITLVVWTSKVFQVCYLTTVLIASINIVCQCLVEEQVDRAFSLALAALLGDCLYNFGELVSDVMIQFVYE